MTCRLVGLLAVGLVAGCGPPVAFPRTALVAGDDFLFAALSADERRLLVLEADGLGTSSAGRRTARLDIAAGEPASLVLYLGRDLRGAIVHAFVDDPSGCRIRRTLPAVSGTVEVTAYGHPFPESIFDTGDRDFALPTAVDVRLRGVVLQDAESAETFAMPDAAWVDVRYSWPASETYTSSTMDCEGGEEAQ